MQWRTGRRSENIEDRRGSRVPIGIAGGGIGTVALLLLALFFGFDPSALLQRSDTALGPTTDAPSGSPRHDEIRDFLSVVLADTEDTWGQLFHRMNREYRQPKLVLFSDQVESACGIAGAAVGPFYCPDDEKLYLDVAFFRTLRDRFGAPGDFAQAYVVAHEIGHHVQNLLGVVERVASAPRRGDRGDANALSVNLELQADCLAGVWAHHARAARNVLEKGDLEEALGAAAAIGDDRLQRQSRGRVAPESFTHGTSEQRVRWFRRGVEAGDVRGCDTFSAKRP